MQITGHLCRAKEIQFQQEPIIQATLKQVVSSLKSLINSGNVK